jgi:hypothetical protein
LVAIAISHLPAASPAFGPPGEFAEGVGPVSPPGRRLLKMTDRDVVKVYVAIVLVLAAAAVF